MLQKVRITLATASFLLLTLLFLDFTGTLHLWFAWLASIQLIPAILAVNVGILIGLTVITLLFGRVYCSVICPLGIFQDGISYVARRNTKKRFAYSSEKTWWRYGVLVVFVVGMLFGISVIVSVLDPYAAFGRMAANFVSPIYRLGNNLLAWIAKSMDSYLFYATDVWIKSGITFAVALITLGVVGVLAWRNGRSYCNSICPVGTILGLLSRFSIFRLVIDVNKCTKCKACERACKSSCIDLENMHIDHSRCVSCYNCLEKCKFGALTYAPQKIWTNKNTTTTPLPHQPQNDHHDGVTRRKALSLIGLFTIAKTLKAQEIHVDGGLATIEDKKAPSRKTPIVPPGAIGLQNMKDHCTACQLCVSACPNNILRPSHHLATFMQPEMSFERGYCRPECTECSSVCPTAAIRPISTADKSGIAIGQAVWIKDKCVVNTDEVQCNNCERHCPTTAISLVDRDPESSDSLKIPVIDNALCIGCGACENLCPARPFSAIYVEGNSRHHTV